MMARCVDKEQTWGLEFLTPKHGFTCLVEHIGWNFGSPYVLGDATCFASHYAGLALASSSSRSRPLAALPDHSVVSALANRVPRRAWPPCAGTDERS